MPCSSSCPGNTPPSHLASVAHITPDPATLTRRGRVRLALRRVGAGTRMRAARRALNFAALLAPAKVRTTGLTGHGRGVAVLLAIGVREGDALDVAMRTPAILAATS